MKAEFWHNLVCWAQPSIPFVGEVYTGVLGQGLKCLDFIFFG
jgi:hypothetical protein